MADSFRTRAWRRAQRQRILDNAKGIADRPHRSCSKPEKQWKFLYTRSVKLARAKQLKLIYPYRAWQRELSELP